MGRVAAVQVAIGLGANLGDRYGHLAWALDRLAVSLDNFRVSSFHETDPVGVGPQPRFLNACAVGGYRGSARSLLELLKGLERERGRERPYPGAPRTLDLDLLLFGDETIEEPDLVVPHPRFRERLFVLEPLAEVGTPLRDPVTGHTVGELLVRARKAQDQPDSSPDA